MYMILMNQNELGVYYQSAFSNRIHFKIFIFTNEYSMILLIYSYFYNLVAVLITLKL